MQEVRGQISRILPLLVSARFQVLFHSPNRGAFHLSLTVLVHYRSSSVFSLGRWSPQLPTGFLVSRGTQDPDPMTHNFVYGAITRSGWPFQCHFTIKVILLSVLQPQCNQSHTGLGCSAFARHYSRNTLFSSGYLDVSVPRVPCTVAMDLPLASLAFPRLGFPIRTSTDHSAST